MQVRCGETWLGIEAGTSYLDFWRAITFWIFADMMGVVL
jgi:hypothetical protein